jgi:hypothetical protein
MYIERIAIKKVAGIRQLRWKAPERPEGWHVIIGDNGSGKSSVLRAAALALVGPAQAWGIRQDWDTWLRHDPDVDHTPPGDAGVDVGLVLSRGPDQVDLRPLEDAAPWPWEQRQGWLSAPTGRSGGSRAGIPTSGSGPRIRTSRGT